MIIFRNMIKYETFDYWSNLVIDNIIWIILVFIVILIIIKIPQSFYISYKLLKWNRWVMWKTTFYHKADIFLVNCWYNLYGIPKVELQKRYFSPIQLREINFTYDFIVKEFLKYKLIELDTHDNRYKAIRNLRNKIIIFLLKNYLIYIVWDEKSHYLHLKQQLSNHLSKKN